MTAFESCRTGLALCLFTSESPSLCHGHLGYDREARRGTFGTGTLYFSRGWRCVEMEVAGVEDSGQLTDGIIEDKDDDEGDSHGERLHGETRVGFDDSRNDDGEG
ncbi:hypothetical protein M405DRAFT_844746 [Rhizopogon salebrosus TDB-379]|nr:hypothetical protein M405DRAFT_844746 [Rhizopogon salebrosus TDB-379]